MNNSSFSIENAAAPENGPHIPKKILSDRNIKTMREELRKDPESHQILQGALIEGREYLEHHRACQKTWVRDVAMTIINH